MNNNEYKYPIPEIGKTYNCYDDGKISKSRRYSVKITGIIPFNKMTNHIRNLWEKSLKESDWLFKETDLFIESISYETSNRPRIAIFARDTSGGWFGLGEVVDASSDLEEHISNWFCSGRLDVKGEYDNL